MRKNDAQTPEFLPVLSRGKHRNPRKGACFMELASYLAGERWSDHPACTHPLLAAVARDVNDYTSDSARPRLAELIPSVIGLTSEDLHVDAKIALRCATTALPIVSAERQRVMAVSVLACQRTLADLDGRVDDDLAVQGRDALDQVPAAAQWAYDFTPGLRSSPKRFGRNAAPAIVRCAVKGIAQACIPNPDEMLHDLLLGAIEDCRGLSSLEGTRDIEPARWESAVRLTQ
jgi:hypothetical protein